MLKLIHEKIENIHNLMIKRIPNHVYLSCIFTNVLKQASRYECLFEIHFSYISIKTYVEGTQNATALLSTQYTCLNWWMKK